jgi:hypothetical protein
MTPIQTVSQVFDAIQQAKAGAPDFCTNFFPVQRKIQDWIDHGELAGEFRDDATFFFRKDRDFHHLYFCASSVSALKRDIAALPELKSERIVMDLVGKEADLNGMISAWEAAGFRRFARLYRMARVAQPRADSALSDSPITFAEQADCPAILALLEHAFNRYGEQIPTLYEIEAAVRARQILAAKHDGALAGLLHFETQGVTSTLRFWCVNETYRAMKFGSALIRKYFAVNPAVKRFNLWVAADNINAVQKYGHYGYTPDGLVDYVLASELVPEMISA